MLSRFEKGDGFAPQHRGGSGPPLVCLHGFMDTWRTWELVLPSLERRHDVLALTLPGHAGGPPFDETAGMEGVLDELERALDAAGFGTVHLAGNSMGAYVALRLAERGRARSVVALAPAGGWAQGDRSWIELLEAQRELSEGSAAAAPHADAIVATAEGRRRASRFLCERWEHLPADLLAHQIRGAAACAAATLVVGARREGWRVDAARIDCPVRIVWGTEDKLLPWPAAADRYLHEWLPHADWVVLDGVGHCPQLDVPLEAVELILGVTAR